MSDKSTYQSIRESRCPHCAAGVPTVANVPEVHHVAGAGRLQDLLPACTAPTAEQVIEEQAARIAELGQQLEHDRTKVADIASAVKEEIASRRWLQDGGRGPYEWDDERYQQEFGWAVEAILKTLEPLDKIAADWSGCPMKAEEVAQARIDIKARIAELERDKARLVEALREIVQECVTNLDCFHPSEDFDECADIDDCVGCTISTIAHSAVDAAMSEGK